MPTFMEWIKGILGKVVTGAVVLAVGAAAVSWYQMPAADRSIIVSDIGAFFAWAALVVALPWMLALLTRRAARFDSNLAGVVLVAGITIAELGLLVWFFHLNVHAKASWICMIACGVVAAAYNVLTCDWIAERFEH